MRREPSSHQILVKFEDQDASVDDEFNEDRNPFIKPIKVCSPRQEHQITIPIQAEEGGEAEQQPRLTLTRIKRGSNGKALMRTMNMTPARQTIIHEAKMIDFRRFRGVRTVTNFEQFYEKTRILGAGNFG